MVGRNDFDNNAYDDDDDDDDDDDEIYICIFI